MTRRLAVSTLALGLVLTAIAGEEPPEPPMANYHLGLLSRGPSWTPERTPRTDSIQAGHMANIQRMADEGTLLAAGPIGDRGNLRGIFIFRADSALELRELVARDPAVSSGRLRMDLFSWHAPAGIGEPYKRLAEQPGHRDSMVRMQLVLLKAGPKHTSDRAAETRSLEAARMSGIFRGLAAGDLATAGSITDGGDLRGILVYRADSATAHRKALEDPAVQAGHLVVEMHPWFAAYGTMPGDTLRVAR